MSTHDLGCVLFCSVIGGIVGLCVAIVWNVIT